MCVWAHRCTGYPSASSPAAYEKLEVTIIPGLDPYTVSFAPLSPITYLHDDDTSNPYLLPCHVPLTIITPQAGDLTKVSHAG